MQTYYLEVNTKRIKESMKLVVSKKGNLGRATNFLDQVSIILIFKKKNGRQYFKVLTMIALG